MGRGAWWATVMGLQRVGHDWATKHVATELADRCQVNQMTSLSSGVFRTVGQIMDWIFMSLYKVICWNPNLRGTLKHGICALIKKIPERSLAPSTMWGHRRQRLSGAGSRLLWNQNLSEHWTWNPSPLELWEIYFCCLETTNSMVLSYSSSNGLRQMKTYMGKFFATIAYSMNLDDRLKRKGEICGYRTE